MRASAGPNMRWQICTHAKGIKMTPSMHIHDQQGGLRALSAPEIAQVAGGLKWTPGTSNADVVDARGGSTVFLGFIVVTRDINGQASSVSVK
jgi:hypothetical protein